MSPDPRTTADHTLLAAGGGPPDGHPGLHHLRRWLAEELGEAESEATRSHVHGCASCAALVATERAAVAAFLARRPVSALESALADRLGTGESADDATPSLQQAKKSGWQRLVRWLLSPAGAGLGFAAAAACVALLVWVAPGQGPVSRLRDAGIGGTRLKAAYGLGFVLRRGDTNSPGADGQRCRAGDRIRVTYTSPADGYLTVVSMDSAGAVTPFYDADGASLPAPAGVQRMLQGAIELDAVSGPERILGCFSAQPLATRDVVAAAAKALGAARGDPRGALDLALPCKQASFVIVKE